MLECKTNTFALHCHLGLKPGYHYWHCQVITFGPMGLQALPNFLSF